MDTTAVQDTAATRITRGYLICIIGVGFWSTVAIFIRYLNDAYQMPSLVLAFWRDAFVVAILLVVFGVTGRARLSVGRQHLRFLASYGFVLSIFNTLWTFSVAYNGAAVSTVLAYSSAAFTAIAGWRLFGERLDRAKVLAVSMCILGSAIVSGAYDLAAWRLNPMGIITGLLSGVAFAAYSLMGKASSQRGLNPWTSLMYTFGFGALFLLAYNLLPRLLPGVGPLPSLFWLGRSLPGWALLVALAFLPTIGGYGLYMVSLTALPASVANLIATLEPSMTAVLAYFFLSERFTPAQMAGSIVIIASVVLLRLSEGRAAPAAEPAP